MKENQIIKILLIILVMVGLIWLVMEYLQDDCFGSDCKPEVVDESVSDNLDPEEEIGQASAKLGQTIGFYDEFTVTVEDILSDNRCVEGQLCQGSDVIEVQTTINKGQADAPELILRHPDQPTFIGEYMIDIVKVSPEKPEPGLSANDYRITFLGWPILDNQITWQEASKLITDGMVAEVVPGEDTYLMITTVDGREFVSYEPRSDDVLKVINQCGILCDEVVVVKR